MRLLVVVVGLLCLFSTVDADKRQRQPRSFVLVLDRSGSMQGAHLDAAREAARAAIAAMDPSDIVTVVGFDTEASVVVRPQRAANKQRISAELDRMTSGGGTDYFPALKETFEILEGIKAAKKHVVFVSDGEAPSDGIEELVKKMHDAKITISTVGIPGADRVLLGKIADAGAGRLHMIEDLDALPKVFVKEVR